MTVRAVKGNIRQVKVDPVSTLAFNFITKGPAEEL